MQTENPLSKLCRMKKSDTTAVSGTSAGTENDSLWTAENQMQFDANLWIIALEQVGMRTRIK